MRVHGWNLQLAHAGIVTAVLADAESRERTVKSIIAMRSLTAGQSRLQHPSAVRLIVLIILLTFLVTWSVSAVAAPADNPRHHLANHERYDDEIVGAEGAIIGRVALGGSRLERVRVFRLVLGN